MAEISVTKARFGIRKSLISFAVVLTLAGGASVLSAGPAQANSPIHSFSVTPSTTQAGGHPDLLTRIVVGTSYTQNLPFPRCFCENPKDLTTNYPPGLIGNPHSTPQCSISEFGSNACPVDSQVGVIEPIIRSDIFGFICPCPTGVNGLFNLVPHPGQAGLFGFHTEGGVTTFISVASRTGSDYGLTTKVLGITQLVPLEAVDVNLWGVPASSIHDGMRFPFGYSSCTFGGIACPPSCVVTSTNCLAPTPSNSAEIPFTENPTTCSGELSASLDVLSYDTGTSHANSPWPTITGCDQLSFNPSLSAQPTTQQTDSASGLDVALNVPQFESPSTPSPSEIRSTTVTLPSGFSINPNAADGKAACSDADARFGTEEAAQCSEFAKVGTLEIDSAALPGPLPGAVYIGEPQPGNRYRIFLTGDGFGVHVKLPGSVRPDPTTGQLVISFEDLPQTPFQDFKMHFFGSERGLLATPTHCGTYPVRTTFTPWDSQLSDQSSTQFFSLTTGPGGTPCPASTRPFAPQISAGMADHTAGAHSPFSLRISRKDGDQNLTALTVKAPPGLAATLKGVPYCPESDISAAGANNHSGVAEQANPSCPALSQIGTATAGAGAGDHPLYTPGKVYLAGPYAGAPLSLVVVTPAVSGPFDLGNVVVRVALFIDSTDSHVTAVSDPLPQILEGIPLRLRSILLDLNRPNFTLNPTRCDPFAVETAVTGDQGAQANPATPFQVASCSDLPFAPKLTTTLSGPLGRLGHPALRAQIIEGFAGEANVTRAAVTLPNSELLDNAHIETVCTRVQFAAKQCPAGSIYGYARAVTPLLDQPLQGPVYLRSSSHTLPDLVVALQGPASQPIEIDLVGRVDTLKGRIRTTFETVPDAEVSDFVLEMKGGKKGLLINTVDLCKSTHRVAAKILAHNNETANQNPQLKPLCGKAARHKRQVQRSRAVG